ncbi:hypothetical protein PCA31118_00335 [Pandoraea captiosa]|uniref:DUF4148 domain-containing protein n=1 Tax=Pandoraea captiosa TaxID=2508302 RepID=A0A5E4ZJ97_9BURK|nr:DUF4148 domain-containing protein [Pandoraea captiosa]VVE60737.1 hypothetical protein PCA31118_00335 [Pandoraea captiosa]
MKTSILAVTTLAISTLSSFATAAPIGERSRAEVRAELWALHDVGYTSASDNTRYPANLQAAQRKLTQQAMPPSTAPMHQASGVATGDAAPLDKMAKTASPRPR